MYWLVVAKRDSRLFKQTLGGIGVSSIRKWLAVTLCYLAALSAWADSTPSATNGKNAVLRCVAELEQFPISSGDTKRFSELQAICKNRYRHFYDSFPLDASSAEYTELEKLRVRLNATSVVGERVAETALAAEQAATEAKNATAEAARIKAAADEEDRKKRAWAIYLQNWRAALKPSMETNQGMILDVDQKKGLAKIQYEYCASTGTIVSGGFNKYTPIFSTNVCRSWATGEKWVRILEIFPSK
jgi:hypothetical protein